MLYTIGEFSRITALSIKSLRLYHDRELLTPARIEEFSGYRYYDDRNVEVARAIKILKDFDFSLAEIKEILDECGDDVDMLGFLETKLSNIQDKIHHYEAVSRSIQLIIKTERESKMSEQNGFTVEEKNVDTLLIAGHRMKGIYSDIGKGFGIVGKKAGRHINGKALGLYYDHDYKEEDADFEACFPVRKGTSDSEVSVRELKGGACVSLLHKGPYDTIGESYKKIFAWINEKGYKTLVPTREVYIKGPGMIFRGNPDNYLTEIVVMLDK